MKNFLILFLLSISILGYFCVFTFVSGVLLFIFLLSAIVYIAFNLINPFAFIRDSS